MSFPPGTITSHGQSTFPQEASEDQTRCRFCGTALRHVFADLGMSPLANSFLPPERANQIEAYYPLRAFACSECFLVQLDEFETPETIFCEYAYFSSYSRTWLEHSRAYVEHVVDRFGFNETSHVVELASNDGYLLQYFREREIPVLGIEPAANVAKVALQKGIPTLVEFFGEQTARSLMPKSAADLLIGNNVLAHVPDLHDFVAGMKLLLKAGGIFTVEFPHLQRLVEENQFDTIYHEHFSYFSFSTACRVFAAHGLRIFDVAELPTHGGSLRIYGCHDWADTHSQTEAARELLAREERLGYGRLDIYEAYSARVRESKREILRFLIDLKQQGNTVVGYGAPAKGNALLNYCGVGRDFLEYTVDLNPRKQGHLLPGSRIPIRSPDAIAETRPDVVFILPWNLREEIMDQLSYIREWGGAFAVRAPNPRLFR